MHLEILKRTEHFLGESGLIHAVKFHQQDIQIATYAESPQATLREGVLGQYIIASITQCGGLSHVFGDIVV